MRALRPIHKHAQTSQVSTVTKWEIAGYAGMLEGNAACWRKCGEILDGDCNRSHNLTQHPMEISVPLTIVEVLGLLTVLDCCKIGFAGAHGRPSRPSGMRQAARARRANTSP